MASIRIDWNYELSDPITGFNIYRNNLLIKQISDVETTYYYDNIDLIIDLAQEASDLDITYSIKGYDANGALTRDTSNSILQIEALDRVNPQMISDLSPTGKVISKASNAELIDAYKAFNSIDDSPSIKCLSTSTDPWWFSIGYWNNKALGRLVRWGWTYNIPNNSMDQCIAYLYGYNLDDASDAILISQKSFDMTMQNTQVQFDTYVETIYLGYEIKFFSPSSLEGEFYPIKEIHLKTIPVL